MTLPPLSVRIPAMLLTALVAALLAPPQRTSAAEPQELARQILDDTGVTGGFVVHLHCGDGKLTAALKDGDRYQVHGLDRDAGKVATARETIQAAEKYGECSVDRWQGEKLPYVDNMVNLLVSEQPTDVAEGEILRVLTPGGVAYVKQGDQWTKTVKPHPGNTDEWTHYLHDATGNAVAHDTVVGPPRHLQWLGSPRWSRHHDRMSSVTAWVAAKGRMFYIIDEGSRISIQLPADWKLVCRDAHNGVILWKRDIPTWHSHLWPLKSGPTQLARRLVTDGETLYVTLGIREPLGALDADTGETLRTYQDTASTEEVIHQDGKLHVLVNKGVSELLDYTPKFNTGDQARVRTEFVWNEKPREIHTFDADSGKLLWKRETKVAPLTLASDGERLAFHDGENVVCLDPATGDEQWTAKQAPRRASIPMNFGPKMVLHDGIVLFAGGDRTMRAFDGKSGEMLWSAPHPQSGYQSPEDLLVAQGLVWAAPTTSGRDTGVVTGRDPKTGEVKVEFPPSVSTYWFHHRCYIAKATDNFLIPSRTGIEFVDFKENNWTINHWVRGSCLYGVLPCNGLLYAGPHNCACYPEAKLFGFNALAPATKSRAVPTEVPAEGRLEKGSAYGAEIVAGPPRKDDWPTFRGDTERSGSTKQAVPISLDKAWTTELGGRLTSAVVADGRLFVAQIDKHTLHAINTADGKPLWSYTAGGRIDSPPTIHEGRVLFGGTDGWVYCLRASDGALVWRFRAAPEDRRLMSEEQLESVWPVHGNILVQDDVAYFVCGRSNFLDGGLRLYRMNPQTGEVLTESAIDDRDPDTGGDLQDRLQTLQMPVGLADIMSGDGKFVYMRSQRFDKQGKRLEVGPYSGDAQAQGASQQGEGAHLFSPTGFLDGAWFHRSYWVFGKSFAGGHNGYYQAGRFAPAGRILAFDKDHVYGFARKPEYLKWTTTIEHQLFSTTKEIPEAPGVTTKGAEPDMVFVEKSPKLNPAGKPIAVEAWVKSDKPGGVIVARGGPAVGYVLMLVKGKAAFAVRSSDEKLTTVTGGKRIVGEWAHLVGQLTKDKSLELYVNGKLVATQKGAELIASDPAQAMEIGGDDKGAVGDYRSPNTFGGLIDEVRVYHGALTAEEVDIHFKDPGETTAAAELVFSTSLEEGKALDDSGNGNRTRVAGAKTAEGKVDEALQFVSQGYTASAGNSYVEHAWNRDVPVLARSLVLADDRLFVAGPPDVMNEEETFQGLIDRDPRVQKLLQEQEDALDGKKGAKLLVVSVQEGSTLAEYELPSLPSWDGMSAAGGQLYIVTEDGTIICMKEKE
ncbi:MAG: PQQ-binding-like beta-propeller repeat protein [Pirellulaceae bacterium]